LVLGKILPYTILGLLDTVAVIAVGNGWFDVPVRGSLLLIFLLSAVFLLSGLGIGLFASTIANTQQEAMLTVFMTVLPSVFLSGFIYPLQAMPVFLQWLSYAIPLRYFLVIIRALMIKGVGLESILPDVIAMTGFGIFIMGAAAMRFRKSID
jgi:ABC-2 type transport system permease protein